MRSLKLSKAFTLLESGPVVLVVTTDGKKHNVMTISWTMVVDFTPRFAMTTGEWNHSFKALRKTRECVIAIPTVDMLDKVVGIGTCSGADTDKFAKFNLTPIPGKVVKAPLIEECLAKHRVQSRRYRQKAQYRRTGGRCRARRLRPGREAHRPRLRGWNVYRGRQEVEPPQTNAIEASGWLVDIPDALENIGLASPIETTVGDIIW